MTIQPIIGDKYHITYAWIDRCYDVEILEITQMPNLDLVYTMSQTNRRNWDEDGNEHTRPSEIITAGYEFFKEETHGKQITKI